MDSDSCFLNGFGFCTLKTKWIRIPGELVVSQTTRLVYNQSDMIFPMITVSNTFSLSAEMLKQLQNCHCYQASSPHYN